MTAQRNSDNVRSVNSQITDAITQANMMNIGLAPAQSLGTLYQTTSQAVGASIQNAVSNQQNMYSLSLASTAQNLNAILSLSSSAAARSTAGLLSSPATLRPVSHHAVQPHAAVHPAATGSSYAPPATAMKK
ncbi:MAG: RebB family R body protein [Sneathiella sp.]|nr:RebB family R body protein [Sneathiella sp.]